MILLLWVASAVVVLCVAVAVYNAFISRQMRLHARSVERDPQRGVMKGAEPLFLKGSSKKAVLLIHGFIGSPRDFADFPRLLHEKGYTVSVPLLPGHGTTPEAFAKTTPEELEAFVSEQYQALQKEHDEVHVVGLSMGASLAILLAQRERLDSLVLAAPYLRIAHQWYYLLPTELYQAAFAGIIPYVYRPSMFKQVNKRESAEHIVDYAYVPLKGAGTAIALGRKALRSSRSIDRPTLILHSQGDRATDYREARRLASSLEKRSASRFVDLPRSNHMIFWDHDAPTVEQEILRFIQCA